MEALISRGSTIIVWQGKLAEKQLLVPADSMSMSLALSVAHSLSSSEVRTVQCSDHTATDSAIYFFGVFLWLPLIYTLAVSCRNGSQSSVLSNKQIIYSKYIREQGGRFHGIILFYKVEATLEVYMIVKI